MSVEYWGIIGYGICLSDIDEYINKEKINNIVRNINPDIEFDDDVFDDDTFCGGLYMNLANFFCELDDSNILCYEDSGDGVCYLLFEPSFPWETSYRKNELKTKDEIRNKIIDLLTPYYNIPINILKEKIIYINTIGCG